MMNTKTQFDGRCVAVLSSENENGHAKQRWSTVMKESPKDRNASSFYKLEGNWSAMGDDAQRKMKDYDGQLSA
ncbi:hypothetical protein D5086_028638 [Populus alba]|uniref:Uncharacterized protein n=1 Tax=Populus alba TaxID=43335 RepID=A0ACC4ARA0_POPAL